jgi:hypothetical protein
MKAIESRYVSDQDLAGFRSTVIPPLQIAIDLAVLAGLGEAELIELAWIDVGESAAFVRFTKSGQDISIPLTDDMEVVLLRSMRLAPMMPRWFVIRQATGEPYSPAQFRAEWRRSMNLWRNMGRATFFIQDLKQRPMPQLT